VKAQRLLSLLLVLQASGRTSARRLALEMEVSERTIYRDVDALAQAGVPVYAERGRLGGIALTDGYRRALTQLGEDDLRSLLVMSSDPLADLGLGDRRSRIVAQLMGALPQSARDAALRARERVLVDQRRWYQGVQPSDILRVLREATWSDRRVEMHYRDRAGKAGRRVVDPLALVSKAGVWYLVARSDGEYRTFRADRISNVEQRSERYERPADFDLDAYWRGSTQRLQASSFNFWITLRVAPHVVADVVQFMEHEIVDREACVVRINFGSAADAAWRLFGWGDDAEVLAPQQFIDELVRRSSAIVARYQSPAPGS